MQRNRSNWTIKKIIFLFIILSLIGKLIFDFSGFWLNFAFVFQYIGYILGYLLFGFIIAYILNAYIDFWDKKLFKDLLNNNRKLKKALCMIIAYMTFFGILSFLIFTLVPALTTTLRGFRGKDTYF
jgi:predicted PurR-regulated permease PerM